MSTQQKTLCRRCQAQEKSQELIGVLQAISVVSKRLAARLTAMEHRRAENENGGKQYVKNG